jgi:hypothetical protein
VQAVAQVTHLVVTVGDANVGGKGAVDQGEEGAGVGVAIHAPGERDRAIGQVVAPLERDGDLDVVEQRHCQPRLRRVRVGPRAERPQRANVRVDATRAQHAIPQKRLRRPSIRYVTQQRGLRRGGPTGQENADQATDDGTASRAQHGSTLNGSSLDHEGRWRAPEYMGSSEAGQYDTEVISLRYLEPAGRGAGRSRQGGPSS